MNLIALWKHQHKKKSLVNKTYWFYLLYRLQFCATNLNMFRGRLVLPYSCAWLSHDFKVNGCEHLHSDGIGIIVTELPEQWIVQPTLSVTVTVSTAPSTKRWTLDCWFRELISCRRSLASSWTD